MENKIFVTAPFPWKLENDARLEAARQRISRAELVRRAVADYLERLNTSASSNVQPVRGDRREAA